jgi:ubiquitin-protein ligase
MTSAFLRLSRDLKASMLDSSDYWTIRPKDNNLMVWEGNIHNLSVPNHRGKNYSLEIRFSEKYPFEAPNIRFLDKVKCEHIMENGEVCLDILYGEWSPAFTICSLMHCLTSLLTDTPVTNQDNKKENTFLMLEERKKYLRHLRTLRRQLINSNNIPENVVITTHTPRIRVVRRRRTEVEMLNS